MMSEERNPDPMAALVEPPRSDGGPAFPISLPGFGDNGAEGMSMRDYFAAHALHAIILADGAQYFSALDGHAKIAYQHADAMLVARKVGGQ